MINIQAMRPHLYSALAGVGVAAAVIIAFLLSYKAGVRHGLALTRPYINFYGCLVTGIKDNKVPLGDCDKVLYQELNAAKD